MEGLLGQLGMIGTLIVRRIPEGYQILNGHLRADILEDQEVDVTVVDLDDAEAAMSVATRDQAGALAEVDPRLIDELRDLFEEMSVSVTDMLDEVGGVAENLKDVGTAADLLQFDQAIQLKPAREYIVVICDTQEDFDSLRSVLSLKEVRRGGGEKHDKFVGLKTERVVTARRVLDACRDTE